nr:hypothetical protein [Tanacetum cinerariifolium]
MEDEYKSLQRRANSHSGVKEKSEVPPSSSSLSLSSNYATPTSLTTPLPTPPNLSEAPTITTIIPDPLPAVIQRLSDLERKFKALIKVDHSKAIEKSVQANIINEVKNQLPKATESLSEYELKKILLDKIDKSHSYMTHEKHSDLYNGILNSIMLDEAIASGDVNPDKVMRKRDRGDDQDPTARSDQGKMKRRKPVNAEEPLLEDEMDVEEHILDDVVYITIQPMSRHDVYSIKKILSVVSVKVDKQYGYGYLEEIVVRRADTKLYTFKEDDFQKLHLNNIEDMLLLHVQKKIFNLDGDDIVDLEAAKLQVRYNKDMSRRKWIDKDQNRTYIMVNLIDKQLLERQIMRSLECLVGGRKGFAAVLAVLITGVSQSRQHDKSELDRVKGPTVLLLPVAPDPSSGELEASVDKLFDEGGSGKQADQGDSTCDGHGVGVQLVDGSSETIAEDVAPAELQRRKKRKTKVVDAGEPSHSAKKLKGDYRAPVVPAIGGKSQSAVQCLLAGVVHHAEVRGRAMPTLPFVSSSVSTTLDREGGDCTKLLAGANLRVKGPTVLLLPVAPDPSSGELEASVDKLFDEGGSGKQADQGDSTCDGHGVGVQLVDGSSETIAEDVAPAELQRRKKRKTKVVDAGEPSHSAKKLK